jgi:hypothetical protein
VGRQAAQEQVVDEQEVGGAELLSQFAQCAELARFVDVFDELMRFEVEDLVTAVDGEQRERFGGVALAGAAPTSNILPINILPKSRSITAFARDGVTA